MIHEPGPLHRRTHPGLDVMGCFGCKVANVAIAASATGNVEAQATNAREKRWGEDMPAYKRLRANGVHRVIDGSARAEATADTTAQVSR